MPRHRERYHDHRDDYEPRFHQRNPKPYSLSPPRHRVKRRRWPPAPNIEDELLALSHEYKPLLPDNGLDDVPMRGEPDQLPILLETEYHPHMTQPKFHLEHNGSDRGSLHTESSDESLGPRTPLDREVNTDRRYVYIPQQGIEIPLTYDGLEKPRTKSPKAPQIKKDLPKLDLKTPNQKAGDIVIEKSTKSPSTRQNTPLTNKNRYSSEGDYFLSPDVASPNFRYPERPRTGSMRRLESDFAQEPPKEHFKHDRRFSSSSISRPLSSNQARGHEQKPPASPVMPQRPPMHKHTSAVINLGAPLQAEQSKGRSRTYDLSSDSDVSSDDARYQARRSKRPSFVSAETPRHSTLRMSQANTPVSSGDEATHHSGGRSRRTSIYRNRSRPPSLHLDEVNLPTKQKASSGQPPMPPPPLRSMSAFGERALPPKTSLPKGLGLAFKDDVLSGPGLRKPSSHATRPISPLSTPDTSPSSTPRVAPTRFVDDIYSRGRRSRPTSRPSSPVQQIRAVVTGPVHGSQVGSPLQPRSGQNTPLPSPKNETALHPNLRIDVQAPSPSKKFRRLSHTEKLQHATNRDKSPHCSSYSQSGPSTYEPAPAYPRRSYSYTSNWPPLPVEDLQPTRKLSEPPDIALPKSRSTTPVPINVHGVHESISHAHRHHRSSMSGHHRSISTHPLPLEPCPRPNFSTAHNDWHTLKGCTTFNICPSCLKVVISTGYGTSFTSTPPKPYGSQTRCDFSIPWFRMAWLLITKHKSPDLSLIYALADVSAREPPCPGKLGAYGDWYRVLDPESGRHISSFDGCSCCVRSLETLFPALRGIFQKVHLHHSPQKRTCDLRSDSKRFARYVDLLEEAANQAVDYRRPPNMLRFTGHVKKMALSYECGKDDLLLNRSWHIMPQLPEFTVCEECYNEVVWPAIRDGSTLASQFNRTLQVVTPPHMGVSCQLYSSRMRRVFQDAQERNDFYHLRNTAVQRRLVERDLQQRHALAQTYPPEDRARALASLMEEWKKWE